MITKHQNKIALRIALLIFIFIAWLAYVAFSKMMQPEPTIQFTNPDSANSMESPEPTAWPVESGRDKG